MNKTKRYCITHMHLEGLNSREGTKRHRSYYIKSIAVDYPIINNGRRIPNMCDCNSLRPTYNRRFLPCG